MKIGLAVAIACLVLTTGCGGSSSDKNINTASGISVLTPEIVTLESGSRAIKLVWPPSATLTEPDYSINEYHIYRSASNSFNLDENNLVIVGVVGKDSHSFVDDSAQRTFTYQKVNLDISPDSSMVAGTLDPTQQTADGIGTPPLYLKYRIMVLARRNTQPTSSTGGYREFFIRESLPFYFSK